MSFINMGLIIYLLPSLKVPRSPEILVTTQSPKWTSNATAASFIRQDSPLWRINLEVERSAVTKIAGEGVFIRGEVIKEGAVFGPYVAVGKTSCNTNTCLNCQNYLNKILSFDFIRQMPLVIFLEPLEQTEARQNVRTQLHRGTVILAI